MMKYNEICGEVMDLFFDKDIKQLNTELAVLDSGAPVIVLQDWTDDKSKDLVVLHLKEAVHLKRAIDNLVMDATLFSREYVEELMGKDEND